MARGRGRGHKGQRRHFTSPEELSQQEKGEKLQQKDGSDSEDDGTGSSDDDSDDGQGLGNKGVQGLIEIANPNRVPKKSNKNLTIDGAGGSRTGGPTGGAKGGDESPPPELSRREREELEKQRARETYQRLHAQGKTDQARADLARLAIIKQQREDAAKRREADLKAREADLKAKQSLTNKALGKK